MPSNIISPLPKEYDNPCEKVRKIKWVFVWYQKCIGLYYWHGCQSREYWYGGKKVKTKPNVVKEALTTPIWKKRLTQSTEQRNYKHPIK